MRLILGGLSVAKLKSLTIQGYKSIQKLDNLKLTNLNILIGANGAGKSNFISIFRFLERIYQKQLQDYILNYGGPDALMHFGRKKTKEIKMDFYFADNDYEFTLQPTAANTLKIINETLYFTGDYHDGYRAYTPSSPKVIQEVGNEAKLKDSEHTYAKYIKRAIESWRVYHFHDTSDTATVKQIHSINNNLRLIHDASNLAAFLCRLKHIAPINYSLIVNTIQLVAPFFDDFVFREGQENIQLEWNEVGNPDIPFLAHILSDGTLRFICLATLLLQPNYLMPDTIIIDEPELGLHPYALSILADLIKRAAEHKQLIISTQSVELIEHFSANDIIVVDRVNNASVFNRLDENKLEIWLDEYSLGDLWKQNIIGGRPSR
jgi:predicted ATPase